MKAAEIEKTFYEIKEQIESMSQNFYDSCITLSTRISNIEAKLRAAEPRADELAQLDKKFSGAFVRLEERISERLARLEEKHEGLADRVDDCETDIHIKSCDGVQLSALLCLIPANVDVKIIDTKRDTGYKPREDYTSSAEFMLRNGGLVVDRVTTTNGGILIEVF